MKKKVIAAGHICLDITPVFATGRVKKPEELLRPGELLQMQQADVHTGGSVANTGLAMKFLGADVSLMGKIGNDAFGKIVLDILKQHDAEKGMLVAEGESTSYSVILAIPGIDRIFLHHPGANDSFTDGDVSTEALEKTALFHFGYPPIMKKMYENQGEDLVRLFARAKAAGAATSLDLAAVDAASEAGKENWKAILTKVMPYVDFFVPSIEELCFMMDRERFEEWKKRAGGGDVTEILDVERDVRPLANQCMEAGAKVLLIKCGAPGMYYRTAGTEVLSKMGSNLELDAGKWADREGFERSFVPERILSGTGAGDTSIAAFLTAMLSGYTAEECVQLAAAQGASCVEAYDALSGLKTLDELQGKIADGWKKAQQR